MQLLESPIPPLTAAALRMIICKRPAPHFDNHKKGIKMHISQAYLESDDDTERPIEEVINSVSVLVNINKMDSLQKISALKVARTEQNPNRLLVYGKELPKQIKCLVQDFLDQDNCF